MSEKPSVLFLCVHNAGRSLAARVLLEHYAEGRVDVFSAGSEPADQLNLRSWRYCASGDSTPGKEFPKPLTDETARAADVIVTMGCGDTCPVYPGRRYLDWDLADPAGSRSRKSGRSWKRSTAESKRSGRAQLIRGDGEVGGYGEITRRRREQDGATSSSVGADAEEGARDGFGAVPPCGTRSPPWWPGGPTPARSAVHAAGRACDDRHLAVQPHLLVPSSLPGQRADALSGLVGTISEDPSE